MGEKRMLPWWSLCPSESCGNGYNYSATEEPFPFSASQWLSVHLLVAVRRLQFMLQIKP